MKRFKKVTGHDKFRKINGMSKLQLKEVIGGDSTGATDNDKHKVKP